MLHVPGTMLHVPVPRALTTLLTCFIWHLSHIALFATYSNVLCSFSNWAVRSHDQGQCQHLILTGTMYMIQVGIMFARHLQLY